MARTFGKEEDETVDEKDSTVAIEAPVPPLPDPPPEDILEEAEEGRQLYLDFLRTEFERSGVTQPLELELFVDGAVSPERLMDWTRAGRELRQLADAFSRSKERDDVRRRAQAIKFESLNFDHFVQLLQELFQGDGITRERILVLFFFCADIAIEAVRRGLSETFNRLINWSLRYIATRVASYVHGAGGWGVVLRSSLAIAYQFTACCAFVAVVAACAVYIRRNWN